MNYIFGELLNVYFQSMVDESLPLLRVSERDFIIGNSVLHVAFSIDNHVAHFFLLTRGVIVGKWLQVIYT